MANQIKLKLEYRLKRAGANYQQALLDGNGKDIEKYHKKFQDIQMTLGSPARMKFEEANEEIRMCYLNVMSIVGDDVWDFLIKNEFYKTPYMH